MLSSLHRRIASLYTHSKDVHFAPLEWSSIVVKVIAQTEILQQANPFIIGVLIYQEHQLLHYSTPDIITPLQISILNRFLSTNIGAVFCPNISDIALKGEGIIPYRPSSMHELREKSMNRKKGWIIHPTSNFSCHLDKEYCISVFKNGPTSTVLLYNEEHSEQVGKMKGFMLIRNLNEVKKLPEECLAFFIYNLDNFGVIYRVDNECLGERMNQIWSKYFHDGVNLKRGGIDRTIVEETDGVYCYVAKFELYYIFVARDLKDIDRISEELMALIY